MDQHHPPPLQQRGGLKRGTTNDSASREEATPKRPRVDREDHGGSEPRPTKRGPLFVEEEEEDEATAAVAKQPTASAATPEVRKTSKNPGHLRKLGNITLADLRLCRWVLEGNSWREVANLYEHHIGLRRSTDTHRKRQRQVDEVLIAATVGQQLINDALQSVPDAIQKINALVAQHLEMTAPPPLSTTARTQQQIMPRQPKDHDSLFVTDDENDDVEAAGGVMIERSADEQPTADHVTAFTHRQHHMSERPVRTISSLPISDQPTFERPTEGGKKPSWALMQSVLGATQPEESEDQAIDEQDVSSEKSEDPQGYVHYEYQVQRRECSLAQYEQDASTIKDAGWQDVDDIHLSLAEANAVAASTVLMMEVGNPPIVNGLQDFTVKHTRDSEGAVYCEYESALGKVQTRVQQRLKTWLDKVPATKQSHWLPRTLFHVKQRITKREDSLFELGRVIELRETYVDGCTSAALAWANHKAIDTFVQHTYDPKTANLNRRDSEIQQERIRLGEELKQEGGDAMFHGTKETTDGEFEIWVEKGRLMGPRNL